MLQIVFMFFKIAIVSAQVCTDLTQLKDDIVIGKISNATTLLDMGEVGIMQCMKSCLQYSLCTSINFINNKCTLLTGETNSLKTYPGAITSMKYNWPAERIAGSCFNKKCDRNSKCVVNSKDEAICEIIGCTGVPTTTDAQYLNLNLFHSKPLWNINDSIDGPCVTPEQKTVAVCQSNGQWSDLDCRPILPIDCSDVRSRNMDLSEDTDIDLDGANGVLPPISVKCQEMNESGLFQVTVGHESGDLKARGHDARYSQKLFVTYKANMDAVTELINRSKSCKQTITVICHHCFVVGNMAWINRRNTLSYYFVGNDVEYVGCSCGLTKSCIKSRYKCNCDINDSAINNDTGEVTNKDDLPVLGMAVGDTGGSREYADISIGPLICLQ